MLDQGNIFSFQIYIYYGYCFGATILRELSRRIFRFAHWRSCIEINVGLMKWWRRKRAYQMWAWKCNDMWWWERSISIKSIFSSSETFVCDLFSNNLSATLFTYVMFKSSIKTLLQVNFLSLCEELQHVRLI